MAKLVFGMDQSLDGYVDHMAFAPSPTLSRHFIEEAQGQAETGGGGGGGSGGGGFVYIISDSTPGGTIQANAGTAGAGGHGQPNNGSSGGAGSLGKILKFNRQSGVFSSS